MTGLLDADALAAVERTVGAALARGDDSELSVLGYGEISLVLGWPGDRPTVAVKRLPVFTDRQRAEAYGELVDEYVATLRTHGVDVVRSEFRVVELEDGRAAGYVVQPVLPATCLAPAVLRAGSDDDRRALVTSVVDTIAGVVDGAVGLDGQLSNWTFDGSPPRPALGYLDVTTPLLRDAEGRSRLDVALLLSPLPPVLRPAVRRFVVPELLARFHDRRGVLLDLAGNLLKERLGDHLDLVLDAANAVVDPPIERHEVERWYRSDARTWELLLRLRRADRWWQRHVRRRTYPYLLPGPIER